MKLTIVLPTCRPLHLSATLDSLAKCELPENFDRLIIIENGTPEPTLENVVENASPHLNISYMHCQEGNKSNALNYVINTLEENQLLFLTDDDVQFDKDILVEYMRVAQDKDSGFVFGGPIIPDAPYPPEPEIKPFIPRSMTGYPSQPSKVDMNTTFFIGSNWAVFSDDVKRLGGFDPRFGPGSKLGATGQETSMMRTMRAAGFSFVLIEDANVYHKIEPEQYSVEFIRKRKFRHGVGAGLQCRIANRTMNKYFPPAKIVVKFIVCNLARPAAWLLAPKKLYYRILFQSHFVNGFLYTWTKKIPTKISQQ